jgi:hypothetical protein
MHQVYKRVMMKARLIAILKEFKIFLSKERSLLTIMMSHRTIISLRRSRKNMGTIIKRISPLSTNINNMMANQNLRMVC